MALGSFIITICGFIRLLLSPIEWMIDIDSMSSDDFFQRILVNIHILKKSAYVICTMRGRSLLSSARITNNLITKYALDVFALSKMTTICFLMIKLLITATVGSLAYCYLINFETGLRFVAPQVMIIMFGTYFIAQVFFSVYSVAVETLFICARKHHILFEILFICT